MPRLEANKDAALLAQTNLAHAQRLLALWALPHVPDRDIPEMIPVPPSTWNAIKRNGQGPELFQIGKRLFATTDALRLWMAERAKAGRPGSKSRRR